MRIWAESTQLEVGFQERSTTCKVSSNISSRMLSFFKTKRVIDGGKKRKKGDVIYIGGFREDKGIITREKKRYEEKAGGGRCALIRARLYDGVFV